MSVETFVAKRVTPAIIMSDNDTKFVDAQKALLACIDVLNQLNPAVFVQKRIKWNFNPPSAPRHGDSWDQLVRICKYVGATDE